jgi:hypothetical protein
VFGCRDDPVVKCTVGHNGYPCSEVKRF